VECDINLVPWCIVAVSALFVSVMLDLVSFCGLGLHIDNEYTDAILCIKIFEAIAKFLWMSFSTGMIYSNWEDCEGDAEEKEMRLLKFGFIF
jgi:hypothetical protein